MYWEYSLLFTKFVHEKRTRVMQLCYSYSSIVLFQSTVTYCWCLEKTKMIFRLNASFFVFLKWSGIFEVSTWNYIKFNDLVKVRLNFENKFQCGLVYFLFLKNIYINKCAEWHTSFQVKDCSGSIKVFLTNLESDKWRIRSACKTCWEECKQISENTRCVIHRKSNNKECIWEIDRTVKCTWIMSVEECICCEAVTFVMQNYTI